MDHLALLEAEVAAMVGVLRDADLAAPVRHCPGWTVGHVAAHLVGVQGWVIGALDNAGPPPEPADVPDVDDPVGTYEEVATAMVEKLAAAAPEAPAWTFDKFDQTNGFWRRRQFHEVAMHRWDVAPYTIDPLVAEDGIDEVLDFFLPRQVGRRRTTIPEGTLRLISLEKEWSFGAGRPVTSSQGTAADLYLGLWRRYPLDLGDWSGTAFTP